jgi:hypothetical protein
VCIDPGRVSDGSLLEYADSLYTLFEQAQAVPRLPPASADNPTSHVQALHM